MPIKPLLTGNGGALVPHEGVDPPVELPLVEELELELPDVVPTMPVELELELPDVVPTIPVELELLLDELEELEELDELEDELDELEELLEVLVLVELCPEFPWPADPPAYIATASSLGKLTPSIFPGTSSGSSTFERTNSFAPL
jgi:hypothetical protein